MAAGTATAWRPGPPGPLPPRSKHGRSRRGARHCCHPTVQPHGLARPSTARRPAGPAEPSPAGRAEPGRPSRAESCSRPPQKRVCGMSLLARLHPVATQLGSAGCLASLALAWHCFAVCSRSFDLTLFFSMHSPQSSTPTITQLGRFNYKNLVEKTQTSNRFENLHVHTLMEAIKMQD